MIFEGYTASHLEQLAIEITKRHPYRIARRPFEVDIDRIISAEGITLLFKRGLLKRHHVAALATVSGRVIVVDEYCYDNVRYEKMVRFTLAEELAHTVLHCPIAREHGVDDKISLKAFMERLPEDEMYLADRNARKLAEAILMPRDEFAGRFHELTTALHAEPAEPDESVIWQLTRDFNLNLKPVVYRAANLQLISDSGLILNNMA